MLIGIGCGVSMVCLGIYLQYKYYLDRHDPPLPAQFTWFPVVCIFSFTICCCVGYLVVPWVMIGELYPQKVRGLVGGMTTFAAHSFVFMVVKTYPMLSHTLQQHGTFILYGVISLAGQYTRLIYSYNNVSDKLCNKETNPNDWKKINIQIVFALDFH